MEICSDLSKYSCSQNLYQSLYLLSSSKDPLFPGGLPIHLSPFFLCLKILFLLTIVCIYKLYLLTHTHPFNVPLSGTTQVGRYQKGKTNLDFTEARDSEWQRHQLGHMQICTSLETNNHASTPPLSFLQAGCPSCRPTNSVKALKAYIYLLTKIYMFHFFCTTL